LTTYKKEIKEFVNAFVDHPGLSATQVSDVIEDAFLDSKPWPRYWIGSDVILMVLLNIVPTFVADSFWRLGAWKISIGVQ
jgi:hypothetical protein